MVELASGLSACCLTFCMLGDFSCFCCCLLIFSKLTFSKKSFSNVIRVSNGSGPDQDRHSVGPDLGPNCSQRLSIHNKSHCQQGKSYHTNIY